MLYTLTHLIFRAILWVIVFILQMREWGQIKKFPWLPSCN
jgi:hypothetical protein